MQMTFTVFNETMRLSQLFYVNNFKTEQGCSFHLLVSFKAFRFFILKKKNSSLHYRIMRNPVLFPGAVTSAKNANNQPSVPMELFACGLMPNQSIEPALKCSLWV